MAQVNKPNTFSANTTISSSAVNDNFDTIYDEFNGNISEANLADSAVTEDKVASGAVTAGKIAAGAVEPDKLGLGQQTATVATDQNTTSTSATDLATVGPSVTVTVPASGQVLIGAQATYANTNGTAALLLTFAASGANTSSGTEIVRDRCVSVSQVIGLNGTLLVTGLTPGSTTFKLQYQTTAGTATIGNRKIWVLPLGS